MKRDCATCIATVTAVIALAAPAQGQTVPAVPETNTPALFTITANVGIYSQYVFRGLTQTDRKPAFQGGFDVAHTSGFYAGTWGSPSAGAARPYPLPFRGSP